MLHLILWPTFVLFRLVVLTMYLPVWLLVAITGFGDATMNLKSYLVFYTDFMRRCGK